MCLPKTFLLGTEWPMFILPPARLPKKEYLAKTSTFVRCCADVVISIPQEKSICLAWRILQPIGWFLFGGGIYPGESILAAAMRHLRVDTGLDLEEARFRYLDEYRYQYVGEEGALQDAISKTFVVECEKIELLSVTISPDEYNPAKGLKQFRKPELGTYGVPEPIMHIYNQIFP